MNVSTAFFLIPSASSNSAIRSALVFFLWRSKTCRHLEQISTDARTNRELSVCLTQKARLKSICYNCPKITAINVARTCLPLQANANQQSQCNQLISIVWHYGTSYYLFILSNQTAHNASQSGIHTKKKQRGVDCFSTSILSRKSHLIEALL